MKLHGWARSDLASIVATLESGSRPKGGASADTGDVPSLGGENILSSGGVTLANVKRVPIAFFRRMTKGHLADGDVLINKDGAQTGKVGMYVGSSSPACVNEHLFLIRGRAERIRQDFLYFTLLSESGQRQVSAQISGSAQPGLKSNFLTGIVVDIPDSIDEQAAIGNILSAADRAIERTITLIAKQQRIKLGLMHDLLTCGIDDRGVVRTERTHKFKNSALGRIPEEWDVLTLDEMTSQIVDGVHHTPAYVDTGVPFVVITDLTSGSGIDFTHTRYVSEADHREFSKRVRPRPGDVLVTKDGTLGVARIVPGDAPEFSIFVSVALLRARAELCVPELIWAFFESGEYSRQLGTQSAGTGLTHIHLEHFRSFLLRRPPVEEQRRIFRTLGHQLKQLRELEACLVKLERQKAGLMQDLLTGRKRVTRYLDAASS